MLKRKQKTKSYKYLENIPGTDQDFKLLAKICRNPNKDMKSYWTLVNPNVIKWLMPFSLYAEKNIPNSPIFNKQLLEFISKI